MKTLKQMARLSLRGTAVGALLLGASVQSSLAGSSDPSQNGSFTWDCVASGGGEQGMAFITFTSDGNFHGYQLLSANPPAIGGTNSATSTVGRGGTSVGRGGGSVGRGGGSTTGGGATTTQVVFGFSPINGTWATSSKGQIIGSLNQLVQVTSVVTNYLASTNDLTLVNSQTFETTNVSVVFVPGEQTTNVSIFWPNPPPGFVQTYPVDNTNFATAIGSSQVADTVSFTAKAVFNKRLTMVCSTLSGKVNYRGVPAPTGTTVDLSGNWAAVRQENGIKVNELFTLTSFQDGNPFVSDFPDIAEFQNVYFTTNGTSGSSPFNGVVMLSQQKHIGFTFTNSTGLITAVTGTLKPTRSGPKATTKGIEEPFNQVNFTATVQQP